MTGYALLLAAAALMLLTAGCSGDDGVQPTATVPEHHRYMWVVITDGYTPAVLDPTREEKVAAVLRDGEIFRVRNLRARGENRHGVSGRWYELEIPEVGTGWVFGNVFRGFYTREQAQQFAEDRVD